MLSASTKSSIVSLTDGSCVLIRPIVPGDKALLRDEFARLSERSRHLRFMAAMNELSEEQLCYLTEIDYTNHMAWVAVDLSAPGELGIGVARCIRLENEPTVADVGFAVMDSHQGRGLGAKFMDVMVEWAIIHDISTLRADVFAENTPMLKLLRRFPTSEGFEGRAVLRVDAMLPAKAGLLRHDPPTIASRHHLAPVV